MSTLLPNEEKAAVIAQLEQRASMATSIANAATLVGLAAGVSTYLFPMLGNRVIWGVALVFLLKSVFNACAAEDLDKALQLEKSKR